MSKMWKKALSLCFVLVLLTVTLASCGGDPSGTVSTEVSTDDGAATVDESSEESDDGGSDEVEQLDSFPRTETLYYNGLQWGGASNWNPFNSDPGAFITINNPVPRVVIYETLFIYNMLDGELHPLIGTDYSWDGMVLTININPDAAWSDGEALTAEDVVYTFELANEYTLWTSGIWAYIDSIVATDDYTVEITAKSDNYNSHEIMNAIASFYIVPKHIWTEYEEEVSNDGAQLMQLTNMDPVASGPYKVHTSDDTKIALVRNDNYWGQADSMWGDLPAPKYIVHNIFKDNPAGDAALKSGQVDVSQQFVSQIWKMWEDGAEVETYLDEAPYYIPGSIPSIVFNTALPGLDDPAVRKAIALVLNYDLIGQNAMSGYSATMSHSLMLPLDAELALVDSSALEPYQWNEVDIDAANALLDEAGWVAGSDGIREKDGNKLSFQVECPTGWTDWMAALEVVAQSTTEIGIDIQTYFPEMTVWVNDRATGDFDILMTSYAGVGIASPWQRAQQTLSTKDVPGVGETAYSNYGRYSNDRADELIDLISLETDEAKLKEYWTELNVIYLEDMPIVGLMYRPLVFHQVNTSVWEGFPKDGDGSNIPPTICTDGYGIAALYNITAK